MEDASLLGGEDRPDRALDLGQRDAELVDVACQQSGQQRGHQQTRDAGLGADRIAQPAEEALLGVAGEPFDAEWQRQHAPPRVRDGMPHDQGADRAFVGDTGLDDQPGRRKRPHADARARRAAARRRQLLRPCADACQLREPAGNRKPELGARAEPHVRGDRFANVHLHPSDDPQARPCPLRERPRAVGLRAGHDDLLVGPRTDAHDDPRGLDPDPEATEAPRSQPGRIEHAEVQPGRRGDHDLAHVRSAT